MAQWGGVAMLAITGAGILVFWLWLWAGCDRFSRVLTVERVYPFAHHPVLESIQKIIWPLIPLVGLAWLSASQIVAQSIVGRDSFAQGLILAGILMIIAGVGLWAAFGQDLPAWAYPGWRAQRYYLAHPQKMVAELPVAVASYFCRLHHLGAPSTHSDAS